MTQESNTRITLIRTRISTIFTFELVQKFIESWGIQPCREDYREGFNTTLTGACFEKMLAEASKQMISSSCGQVLFKFLEKEMARTWKHEAYIIANDWQELEERWDDFLANLVRGK